jgi:hypothetical protein
LLHQPPFGGIDHGHHIISFNYYYKKDTIDSKIKNKQKLLYNRGKYEELSKYYSSFVREEILKDLDAKQAYSTYIMQGVTDLFHD